MDHLIEDSDRLKPCPFCGGAAEFVRIDDEEDPHFGGVVAACLTCGATSKVYFPLKDDVKHLLMEAWNKRAPTRAYRFAGWFAELRSGMSYRLWEQGGHEPRPGDVALYEQA
jgi:Lar family restriction alleviation protein